MLYVNGVAQTPGIDFNVSGATLTTTSTLPAGTNIATTIQYFNTGIVNTPADATVTDAKANFVSTASAAGLQIKGDGTTDGVLQLNCSQNTHGIKLKSPPHSATADYTLTFPNDDGDANEVLKTNGSGVLSWGAGGGWAFVSAVTASGSSSVVFAGMATGYDYQIVYSNIQPATDAKHFKCLLGIAGPTYRTSAYYGTASGLSGTAVQSNTETTYIRLSDNNMGTATDEQGRGMITLIDPANSGTDTNYLHQSEYHNSGSGFDFAIGGGHYQTSEAHTDIQFLYASGNIATGFFKLYQRPNA